MTHSYNYQYAMGDIVFLKTDVDQKPRIVVKHIIYPDQTTMYGLAGGTLYSEHYEIEISSERNILL